VRKRWFDDLGKFVFVVEIILAIAFFVAVIPKIIEVFLSG